MPSYSLIDLLLLTLAVLYVTHVITQTEGPRRIFWTLREKTRLKLGGMLDCPWCAVFWVALALFIVHQWVPGIAWVFGIAGAAMALRSYTGTGHGNGN